MSVRTVSQLPLLDLQDVIYNKNSVDRTNFRNSLVEVSYNESEGKYKSMRMKLGDYYDYVYYNILSGGDEGKTVFTTQVDFTELVKMYNSLHLCGDLIVNEDLDDDEASQYRTYIKAGTNTFYGTEYNQFISPRTDFQTDEIWLKTFDGTDYGYISRNHAWLSTQVFAIDGNLSAKNIYGDLISGDSIYGGEYYGSLFHGTALCAKWADLAETYESDREYESGTLVKFGGEKEITIAHGEANAVITTNPGFVLNGDRNGCQVALVGRTPVKTVGRVKKFDHVYLSPFDDGIGATAEYIRSRDPMHACLNGMDPIGRALESNDDETIKLVECVV